MKIKEEDIKKKYMDEKVLTKEQELEMLVSSYEMLKHTKEEAELRGRKDSVGLIANALEDALDSIRRIDPSKAEELINGEKPSTSIDIPYYGLSDDEGYESIISNDDVKEPIVEETDIHVDDVEDDNVSDYDFGLINSDVQYDIIPLPSKGQCYKRKNDRIPVAYLTAYDENLITSPNLYRDGLVIDLLLKQKVLDKTVVLDELCSGDVDAITLFLRATSYGTDFPIVVLDPETGEKIETTVDLSELKMKEFSLEGDADGYFDFTLPVSKDVVKFKFLTRKDEKILKKLAKLEENGVKSMLIKDNVSFLKDAVKTANGMSGKEKQEYTNSLVKLEDYAKKLEEKARIPYTKTITNRLELSVMAVNGNYDRKYVSKYIKNMGAKDSLMLRRYMIENEPGVDFQVTVNRPASLGGGSFTTFLEWDDSVFLNIA